MNNNFPADLKSKFKNGAIIAYPTEAVFGLGCDPTNESAVFSLLKIKQRPVEKGVILIASDISQLLDFIDMQALTNDRKSEIFASWPGPNTWLVPKSERAKDYLTGGSELIAVRVSAHPRVRELCQYLDSAIVSTSANISGAAPAKTLEQAKLQFEQKVVYVQGTVGDQQNPTQIRNGLTGQIIRAS